MFPGASKTIQNDNESSGESEENISRDDDRDTGTLFMQQFDACEQNVSEFISLYHSQDFNLRNAKNQQFLQMLEPKSKENTEKNRRLQF
ncbi:unnamed protein product [Adineta steineri]|uniref:Uncharacterized protein n=2 Tax=Adineta steineri TaxID=433720 RepID=A0A814JVI9_9BILA|nr:unnamed protein product [Adineta steineri]CAF3815288.1 unnamed protein product [Adineta steineri]